MEGWLTCSKDLVSDVLTNHAFVIVYTFVVILVLPTENGWPAEGIYEHGF